MIRVMYEGISGLADFNIAGYKFGNVMFYPDNEYPFYRRCVKIDEIKIVNEE